MEKLSDYAQKAIDDAVLNIVAQGHRCFDKENQQCLYVHGEDRCVIGWMMHNPQAAENISYVEGGLSVREIIEDDSLHYLIPNWMFKYEPLLDALQEFHDEPHQLLRRRKLEKLEELGLDISADQYEEWVKMGFKV